VRRFAHHPAQRLDKIRFAAAIRPDDARQAGLDQEIGGSTKDLKPIRRNRLSFIDDLPRADGKSGLPCEIGL